MSQWRYEREDADGRIRVTLSLSSALPISIGSSGLQSAQLQFVDDSVSGYYCLLLLGAGDFRVSKALARHVDWSVDGAEPTKVRATRPEDAVPARVSLLDPRDRWFELTAASRLTITFQGNDNKRHKVLFDVSGLDRSRLDWDGQKYADYYRARQSQSTASAD